jgi:hypothetical protein
MNMKWTSLLRGLVAASFPALTLLSLGTMSNLRQWVPAMIVAYILLPVVAAFSGRRPDALSLDIALAFAAYVHATGNMDYARRIAWPVLRSVGEFVASRVSRTARGFEIADTVGPREYYEPVTNNAFTNMAAATVLRQATGIAAAIGEEVPALWCEIAPGLVLPRDTSRGTIVNHDGARLDEPQGGVPEGAAGLFPVGYPTSEAIERATYRYAATEQAPSYLGAPMLSALMPVYAARAGEPSLARDLLEPAFGDFINEPFLEPDEVPRTRTDRPRASPMFANLSGYLTGLLYGFTGLRPSPGEPQSWAARPPALPRGWRGIAVERVWVRGQAYSLDARPGMARAALRAESPSIG